MRTLLNLCLMLTPLLIQFLVLFVCWPRPFTNSTWFLLRMVAFVTFFVTLVFAGFAEYFFDAIRAAYP